MTTTQSTITPAPGFPQRETRFPKPQGRGGAWLVPPVNPEENRRTKPFVPVPAQEFEDEDWVCCRSID